VLAGLDWTATALLMLCGVLLDLALGEPRRFHPLVGFGKLAALLERRLNHAAGMAGIARGALGWTLAVIPLAGLSAACISLASSNSWVLHALLLYFALGLRSLRDHNLPIARALQADDLPNARRLTSYIVSRETSNATPEDLAKASTESLLENGNDAVFGALFWFAIAGGPGALLFRLANTLDAMWGYRNQRYNHFGRFAARIDDVLNFIPARLTALSYALLAPTLADKQRALRCWRETSAGMEQPKCRTGDVSRRRCTGSRAWRPRRV